MQPVKDNPTWYRNNNGTLVNTDMASFKSFQDKRKIANANVDRINRLEQGFNEINNKMDKLISLLSGTIK